MTYNPAKLYNFEAGYLAENGPADITIFDDKADRTVGPDSLQNQPIHHLSVKP